MLSNMTNFPNGITSLGIPVIGGGGIPVAPRLAKYYFVDKQNGSDSYTGESWDCPLATIAAAITKVNARISWSNTRWANRDIIVIAPGVYTENLTSLPYGAVMYGLGFDTRDGQNGVKIKPATGAPVDVAATINTEFWNIGFETAETDASDRVFDATIINNCHFFNCWFSGPAETATAVGVYASDCTRSKWIDCEFTCCDIGMDIEYADAGDGFNHCLIDRCHFMQCDTAGLKISTNLVGPSSIVRGSIFVGAGQTMAIGIDDNSAILDIIDCRITATDPIQGCRSSEGCYGNGELLLSTGESS